MKVLVFGAGAIGGVLGALLSSAHDVTLVTRGEHLKEIQKNGLFIEGLLRGSYHLPVAENTDKLGRFDLVIITTKSYDTLVAGKACAKSLTDDSIVLSIQNGIGNDTKLSSILKADRIVIGVTSMAAHRIRPGTVKFVADEDIVIGTAIKHSLALPIVKDAFEEAEIEVRVTDNIQGVVWAKAILNAAINPLTAIRKCKNGLILSDETLRSEAMRVCEEGMQVASAKRIRLEPSDMFRYTFDVAERTAENRSSMLLDIESGRRTEIDSICGAIIEAGKEVGVETPTISRLYSAIKLLESGQSTRADTTNSPN